jgi:phosphate:Na+ symporter
MSLLTEGLNSIGGRGLRGMLRKLTDSPPESFVAGTAVTVLTQSSSATVLSTIGFLAAGMIPLSACVGLVVGATVGTSSTSWLVSVVGLNSASFYFVMPALGLGALLRMFGRGRWKQCGTALAGLAVLLASIKFISDGLGDTANHFDLASFAANTASGDLMLCASGLLMAVAMQSSAAPIAITMVMLNAGTLTLDQACFVLMGATVGTTSTGIIVSIVGGLPARRVALLWSMTSVVQVAVGVALFPLLKPVALAVARMIWGEGHAGPEALAVFHTTFTLVAGTPVVWLSLPVARMAAKVLPARRGEELGFELDPNVLQVPSAAVAAARKGVIDVAWQVGSAAQSFLRAGTRDALEDRVERCGLNVDALRGAISQISVPEGDTRTLNDQINSVLAVDHLARMVGDMRVVMATPIQLTECESLHEYRARALACMDQFVAWLSDGTAPAPTMDMSQAARELGDRRKSGRTDAMLRAQSLQISPERAIGELEMMRQIDRMVRHATKVTEYLSA